MSQQITPEELRAMASKLNALADQQETKQNITQLQDGDNIVEAITSIIANLVQRGLIGIDLRRWFTLIEKQVIIQLIRSGANTVDLAKILHCSSDSARHYLHRQSLSIRRLQGK